MRSFLLLLYTLLAFLSFSELSQARDIQPWLLSCTSSCGDIQNISYPFRLSGQPSGCGDPDYTLSCDNKKLILEFDAGKYYVKSINYETKRIRVVDVNLANETCSLPTQSIYTYNVQGDLRYKGTVYNEEISFVNCSRPINDTNSFRIPCMSTQNGSIFYAAYESQIVYGTEQVCSYPPLSVALAAREDLNAKSPSSFEDIQRLLQGGFDMSWSVECRDCIRSGRECSFYNNTKPYHVCRKPYNERDFVIKVYLVIGAIAIAGLLLLALLGYLIYRCIVRRKAAKERNKLYQSLNLKRYTYNDIISMTSKFGDKLRESSFGSVYKGKLPSGDLVAVQILDKCKINEKDFADAIQSTFRTRHANLIALEGFCFEASKRALVFEYMPNGSLKELLLSKGGANPLSLLQLQEIALGAAKGIHHLHAGTDSCILHLGLNPSNILLEENFNPKVSDYGLKKLYPKDDDFLAIGSEKGDAKYMAPELMTRNSTAADSYSDVYSFGMILLEMVGNVLNLNSISENSHSVSRIFERLSKGEELDLGNVAETETRIARKLCMIGLWSTQVNPSERPSMSKVVEMLEHGTEEKSDDFPSAP